MKKIIIPLLLLLAISCKKEVDQPAKVIDVDGNIYKTVTIGTQTWMTENLKVTHYRNGDLIPNVMNDNAWLNLTTGAYSSIDLSYGNLYNWYAIENPNNISPLGWHIPTNDEWKTLINYLGGKDHAGIKMQSKSGWDNWEGIDVNGNNESGFTALPGGWRNEGGGFEFPGSKGYWWSSTESYSSYYRLAYSCLIENPCIVDIFANGIRAGFSVRCIKDSN